MGLGAWLAAKTEEKHYYVEEEREKREVAEVPLAEEEEIYIIFTKYGIERATVAPIVKHLRSNEDMWVKVFMSIGQACHTILSSLC